MWVRARQYTGRIVTVTNDKIFDEPVYNYTRDFPYIWEEMQLWISYSADRSRTERILLDAAERHGLRIDQIAEDDLQELKRSYLLRDEDIYPCVYWRLTTNWLELTLRFLVHAHGIRVTKNEMVREILAQLEEAGIGIASTTFEVVGLPELKIRLQENGPTNRHPEASHAELQ
jgi:small-conductance mechanosensitive channel